MIRLTGAPVKVAVVQEDLTLQPVWLQFVGDLADSLQGYWGKLSKSIILTGVTSDDIGNTLVVQSNIVTVLLTFKGLVSVDAICTIPDAYKVMDSVLHISRIDDTGSVSSIPPTYVEDSQFKIPDLDIDDTVIISGILIRR